MVDNTINMLWLYPDLLNLHGDRGNIMAFERVADMMDLKLNVNKVINLTDEFSLDNVDIIFMNPGELSVILDIIKTLKEHKKEIVKFVEEQNYLIAIGTSGAVLSKKIYTDDEKVYSGLELIDMECTQRKTVIGDDIYFSIDDEQEIIGSQIQMIDFRIDDENALGKLKYGYGNIGNQFEGGRKDNAIFTNALGPIFVKNPWWAEKILREVAKKKNWKARHISVENFKIEVESFNSTKKFIEGKEEK